MKKQHIILIPAFIMLHVIFLIISYKYDEYKINKHINNIIVLNQTLKNKIDETKSMIEYKSSKAYINKILKQEQNKKNKNEVVFIITPQKQYEKYTSDIPEIINKSPLESSKENIFDNMTIKQKWIYFLFKKDTR